HLIVSPDTILRWHRDLLPRAVPFGQARQVIPVRIL
ncbi:MAG: hypothetical protein JWR24_1871, partial [Actinoallomurus sp.]|nr:hypothetical protein [Actinoallomurus sp.]